MLAFTRVAEAKFSPVFKDRILQVYSLFPELHERQIKCGFIRRGSRIAGSARSWTNPKQIALQPDASTTTIAHEFTHLLQGKGNGKAKENGNGSEGAGAGGGGGGRASGSGNCVPHGEKACDIWAICRLPAEMADKKPSYLLGHWSNARWLRHKESVRRLCLQAIQVRNTDRAYIKWLSAHLRQLR